MFPAILFSKNHQLLKKIKKKPNKKNIETDVTSSNKPSAEILDKESYFYERDVKEDKLPNYWKLLSSVLSEKVIII